jgi:hypothetical protein
MPAKASRSYTQHAQGMRIVRTLADSLECEDIITHAALRIRSTLAEIGAVYLLGLPPLDYELEGTGGIT